MSTIELAQQGKASPASFARVASRGLWQLPPHLALLNYYLLLVYAGVIPRLMVNMPPRHGKSELISHYFPAWWIGMRPHARVLFATYESQFGATWGRAVRNTLEEWGPSMFGVSIAPDSKAQNRWNIAGTSGGMVTNGIGGSFTGRGGDLMIVDDPIKNDKQANSATYREAAWQWWRATWRTRAMPGSSQVQVNTRWHEDDLGGRVLQQAAQTGEEWTVLSLPAIAIEEENDVLGWHRMPGDPLWPEQYNVEDLKSLERDVGSYWWSALYQQKPQRLSGGIFKRQHFRYWHGMQRDHYALMRPEGVVLVPMANCRRFITVDPAISTKTSADFTAVAAWALTPAAELVLLDMEQVRMEGPDQPRLIKAMFDRWRVSEIYVETVAYQLSLFQTLRRGGLPVRKLEADKDKVSRALSAAARIESGDVYFPQVAPWLGDYESQLLEFDKAAHDDMVDATSYAAQVIAKNSGPGFVSF